MTELININRLDDIGTMYVTINTNFDEVETAINDLETIVDTELSTLTGRNLTLEKGERPTSTVLFTNEGSELVKGTLEVQQSTTLSNVSITTGSTIELNSSALNLSGEESSFYNEGSTDLAGKIVLSNFNEAFIDGANTGSYIENTGNTGTFVVGNRNAVIFDFSNYSASEDVENVYTVKDIILDAATEVGQSVTLVVNANSSVGKPHRIKSTNIISMTSGTHINCNGDYCVIDLIWLSSGWIVKNLHNATIS